MRRATRRVVVGLVGLYLLIVALLGALWAAGYGPWHDRSYHGSIPSTSLTFPATELAGRSDLVPRFPSRRQKSPRPIVIVVTCLDCRSGDVIGGFLGRMTVAGIDDRIDLRVIAIGGNARAWQREWKVPARWIIHRAPAGSGSQLAASLLRVGESGQLQLYDARGHWKSTWHLGQLDITGVRHDLDVLARERS